MLAITLRQLQVFECVARHLSHSRAAQELYLSQPAVSMQIKQAEQIVGLPLFEQSGKRIFLTEAGRELLHYARAILQLMQEMESSFDAMKGLERGRLNIAVVSTANYFMPQLLARFIQIHPGIQVALSVANRDAVLRQLSENLADLAIMGQPPAGTEMTASAFLENPLVVIAAPNHALASARKIQPHQLVRETFLLRESGSGTRSVAERYVALMQAQSSRPVKTFTIGFNELGYDEAIHAKAVARHLGTEHTELYVAPQQAMEVIPRLPDMYCEPFADSSQIPTFLVSQLAKRHVTVSLSGDAGDELFCGYNRYQITNAAWRKLALVPRPIRTLSARCIGALSPSVWDRLASFIPGAVPYSSIGDKLHKGAEVLASSSADELYLGMVSHLRSPSDWVVGGEEPATWLTGRRPRLEGLGPVERMMALDLMTYLPDDILVKVDRAAMGVSLESRVPFLDHRLVEFAWSLPLDYKLCNGQTKWPLRQVLYRYVPPELIERPKMGFGIPLHDWLRGPLRDWAEILIGQERLEREGYFHAQPIRQKWREHLSGKRNWAYLLWNVLMFQAWLEAQK
jgi:DNA-binding transcriptional LysR family regulator